MSDLKTLFKNSSADGEDPDSRLDRGRDSEAYADRGGGMAAHLPPGPVKSMVSREINKILFWKLKEKIKRIVNQKGKNGKEKSKNDFQGKRNEEKLSNGKGRKSK